MKHFVGIDLGTTNSSICSYDGKTVRVWKSREQNDVTPSAIFVDRRGTRYYGRIAYEKAFVDTANSAVLFKRYMGTKERFLKGPGLNWTPEECSAEVLKVLFAYLPEEIRNDPGVATVITVPAAFNQMKKDATLEAAQLAGLGKVALMQEPVAAIMSVMRMSRREGVFLIYDLGGGTFDVSIADNIGGKVNLLSQGGKEMCGGRDWDRLIYNSIVVPWLRSKFNLPDDFLANEQYRIVHQLSKFAAEQAKIELSSSSETIIRMDEDRLRCKDISGNEIYLDIPFTRFELDSLIEDLVEETIKVTQTTMADAGYRAEDIEMVVFVGGPTNYKPLRDKVCGELALRANMDVNPMTAVAEGASIFAESIDWTNPQHKRKAANMEISSYADISLRYDARTPEKKARIAFLGNNVDGLETEIISSDTGWTSGRVQLKNGTILEIPLAIDGDNTFEAMVYNRIGRSIPLKEHRIIITKTLATIRAIPAPHSIGAEVLDRPGGSPELVYLIQKNDSLPRKGSVIFKAGRTLKAGSDEYLHFRLWEGEIRFPVSDNRWIGYYKIHGKDFDEGIVPVGADIICDYEISDAGTLHLGVSIPCIHADFGDRNHYSRQEGQLDLDDVDHISDGAKRIRSRIDKMSESISDPRLERAREKADRAMETCAKSHDHEEIQRAHNDIQDSKELLEQVRRDHRKESRQAELDECINLFNRLTRKEASPSEADEFDTLTRTVQRAIDNNESDAKFNSLMQELWNKNTAMLLRQDWFIIHLFNTLIQKPYIFLDGSRFEQLKLQGQECVRDSRIDVLRTVIRDLLAIQKPDISDENILTLASESVNVVRG